MIPWGHTYFLMSRAPTSLCCTRAASGSVQVLWVALMSHGNVVLMIPSRSHQKTPSAKQCPHPWLPCFSPLGLFLPSASLEYKPGKSLALPGPSAWPRHHHCCEEGLHIPNSG